MAAFLLAALVTVLPAVQSPNVSFSCRAESLSRLIPDLGAAAKVELSVSPACAGDVLVVSATGVPVRTLMDEIAKVDAGEWQPSGNGFTFVPDPVAHRNEEQHEKAHQGNLIHAAILKKLKEAQATVASGKGEDSNFAMAMPFGLGGNGPGQIAVLSLLKEIDPPSLVVDETHRAVFSTSPNSMQLPLGSGADEIIQKLIERHNAAIPKETEVAKNAEKQVPAGVADGFPGIKSMMEQATTPVNGYAKADLVIAPMPYLGGTTASLILYDNKGKVILTAQASIDAGLLESIIQTFTGKPGAPSGSSTPIELSPATQAYLQFSGMGSGQMMQARLTRVVPADLKPFLADPVQHDPLSLLPTDEILALAKSAKEPLVAVVPDSALSLSGLLGKPTLEEFVQELDEGKTMIMSEQKGWIEIKPIAPESARENRTDRAALAKLLKATAEKRVPSLDDIAEFAQSAPSPMTGGVTQIYLSLFVPGAINGGMNGFTNWDMVRMYGQITPDRRAALLGGAKVSLDALSGPQQGYLNEMVYGPLAELQVGESSKTDLISTMMSMFAGGGDYKAEATELLPNGIPSGGVFEMTAEEQPFLIPEDPNGQVGGIPTMLGMDEMALFKYFSEQPMFAQASAMMPKLSQMKVGHRTVYHLTFRLNQEVRLTGTLNDNSIASDAETVDANDLPQDMQNLIAKKIDEFKKSPLGAVAGLGAAGVGAGSPPPR